MAPPDPSEQRKRRRKVLFWILGLTFGAMAVVVLLIFLTVKGVLDKGIELSAGDAARSLPAERAAAKAEGLPLTPEELFANREKVRDEDNAAPIYLQAIEEMKAIRKKGGTGFYDEMTNAQVVLKGDFSKLAAAQALVSAYAKPIALAEQAAAKPRCDFHRDWSQGLGMLLPELSELKSLSRIFSIRAVLKARARQFPEAAADLKRAFAIAGHAAEEPGLIQMLVGIASTTFAHDAVRQVGALTGTDPGALRTLASLVEATPQFDLVLAIKGECVVMVTSIRSIPKWVEDPIWEVSALEKAFATNPKVMQAGEARTIRFYREVLKAIRSGKDGPEILNKLEKVDEKGLQPDLVLRALETLDSGAPAARRSGHESTLRYRTMQALSSAFLKVLSYRAANRRWPQNLAEANASGEDALAAKPLQYKALRNGFKVWGVGMDLEDDGGVYGKTWAEGDQLVWYEEGKGLIQPPKRG